MMCCVCSYILIAKTDSNSCRRDCHSNFAEIRVFFKRVAKKKAWIFCFFSHLWTLFQGNHQSPMGFPSLTPTTPPPLPNMRLKPWQGNVVTKDIDITATILGVFVCCLMANWLQFRWEKVWNVKWTCEWRIENGWVERATEKSLMMMPCDAFWLCYTIRIIPTLSFKTLSSCHCPAYPFSHLTWKIQSSLISKTLGKVIINFFGGSKQQRLVRLFRKPAQTGSFGHSVIQKVSQLLYFWVCEEGMIVPSSNFGIQVFANAMYAN